MKVRATTHRTASSYAESWTDKTATSTSTRTDSPEDIAARGTGIILREGAVGAGAGVSGRCRLLISRQISRQICHLKHFTTERGTTSRKITPTTTNTGDTRGGKQRDYGHHHQRRTHTSTNTGSPLTRGALVRAHMARLQAGTAPDILLTTGIIFNSRGLARGLTATMEGGTASAILPTTGVLLNSSGRPPAGKVQVMVFPRLGPKFSNSSDTATDAISLRTRGLPSNSSSTNTSRTLRGRRCHSRGGGMRCPYRVCTAHTGSII